MSLFANLPSFISFLLYGCYYHVLLVSSLNWTRYLSQPGRTTALSLIHLDVIAACYTEYKLFFLSSGGVWDVLMLDSKAWNGMQ